MTNTSVYRKGDNAVKKEGDCQEQREKRRKVFAGFKYATATVALAGAALIVAAAVTAITIPETKNVLYGFKKETAPECQKNCTASFVVSDGKTITTEFFGPHLDVKVTKISADHVELFGTVPYVEGISNMNETLVILFGGKMVLHGADPSGKHNEWSISAEKGLLPGTAFIKLSN